VKRRMMVMMRAEPTIVNLLPPIACQPCVIKTTCSTSGSSRIYGRRGFVLLLAGNVNGVAGRSRRVED
jgi:hypothetical protein